ncbi:MAG: ATP-binding protein [Pyrinomonadaceae bacterium]|nr:ATP-binding protein [Pyrinomonadaceae bacterium]
MNEPQQGMPETMAVSERLTREVGVLAGRLAQFLAGSLPRSEGASAEGHAFLWATFESVAGGQPLAAWEGGPLDRRPDGGPHPLDRLADRLSLSGDEISLLLLAGMAEEHEGYAAVLRTLHPRGEPRASIGLAAQLLCRGPQDRLRLRTMLVGGALVKSGAVRATGDNPFFERSLQPMDALWSALHGLDVWPASISRLGGPIAMSGLEQWLGGQGAGRAIAAIKRREPCTILVTADGEEEAFERGRALVHHANLESIGIALTGGTDAEQEQAIGVHALVRGGVPVMRMAIGEGAGGQGATPAPRFSEYPEAVVISGREGTFPVVHNQRPIFTVPVERLSTEARRRMWRETLPRLTEHAPFLAARYPIEPAGAAEVAADLRMLEGIEERTPTLEDVAASIRARGGLSLSGGVKLIRPSATFDDLVLPRDRLAQLHEAIKRLMLQARVFDEWGFLKGRTGARGVRMLFAGPPGTGKTLSAEVLANSLAVDLLVVDISRVVSKWIGETEKNLAAVFDTAERAQAVLLFDEADALFGKRTEVSDAHDRYANLETAYLLARLERFEGLAILATNLRQNIDPAFLRRLEFVVDFDEPDREERHTLWRCHLPADVPLDEEVNLYELAALYPVVGGVIRNAAVAAGFLAAADETPIFKQHFIRAIRREYDKAGRAFPGVPAGTIAS